MKQTKKEITERITKTRPAPPPASLSPCLIHVWLVTRRETEEREEGSSVACDPLFAFLGKYRQFTTKRPNLRYNPFVYRLGTARLLTREPLQG